MSETMHGQTAPGFSAPFVDGYLKAATLCLDWLEASQRPTGGSAAHASLLVFWSRAYPETTGYIIPTLLQLGKRLDDGRGEELARRLGAWLLSIQEADGCWKGGLYPYSAKAEPSIFNTGQILFGLTALAAEEPEGPWTAVAARAAHWLAAGIDGDGQWRSGHYRGHQPAYYSHVAWPMLEYATLLGDKPVETAAGRVLDGVVARRRPNGAIEGWGFDLDKPAFTHTIAYTLQGLLESARLTGNSTWREATRPAMEKLRRAGELGGGRLPGTFDMDLRPDRTFECLTGTAQTALCCLRLFEVDEDLRWLNAASKFADRLVARQGKGPLRTTRGAIAGSVPAWAAYMRFRSPNWSVKFTADAFLQVSETLERLNDR